MVETRSRRKSTAPAALASSGGGSGSTDALPSSSGRPAAAAATPAQRAAEDYAQLYRHAALKQKQAEQSNIVRRLISQLKLFWHQQSISWGLFMLEPWETALWLSFLLLLTYFVLSACFVNPSSICNSTLVAVRNSLAARGAKLLAYTR